MNGPNHILPLDARGSKRAIAQDSDPVSAVRKGPTAGFAEIHAVYSRRLYRTIIAITKSPEDAEDALQDTLFRAYLAFNTFEGRSSVYSWLTRIAVNSALMILRKRRARPEILFDPQPEDSTEATWHEPKDTALNPEQECDLRQRQLVLLRAIGRLDPPLRGPIRMQMIHGWSMREISRALNISLAAVKTRLHRARLRLSTRHDLRRCGAYDDGLSAMAKSNALLPTLDRSRITDKRYSEREGKDVLQGSSQSVSYGVRDECSG